MRSSLRFCVALMGLGAAMAPAFAQVKPVLTVYTYSSFVGKYGPAKTVEERFEATCGCDLQWVTAEDAGSLVGRLRLEGERHPGGRGGRPRHEPRRGGQATSQLFAPHGRRHAGRRGSGAVGGRHLHPLRLGLPGLRVRFHEARVPADEPEGPRGRSEGPDDRAAGSAHQRAGARLPAVDAQGLRGRGRRGLDAAQAADRHLHPGLVRGVWPLPEGRGRHGDVLHDVSRLPQRGGAARTITGRHRFPRVTTCTSSWPA